MTVRLPLDPQADIGNGVDAVHVWARRRDIMAGQPVFLGAAALREHRPDVGRAFGAQFDTAGYRLTTTVLPAGRYEVTAYAWNRRTRRWEDARSVSILVR